MINQETNYNTNPAPPLIIRQQPARAETPEPLVFREAPPSRPRFLGQKIITISGEFWIIEISNNQFKNFV